MKMKKRKILSLAMVAVMMLSAFPLLSLSAFSDSTSEGLSGYDWKDPVYEEMDTTALDSDPGTLKFTESEDGKTVTISYTIQGQDRTYTVPNNNNYLFGGFAGTDDLSRSLYSSEDVGNYGSTGDKAVGLFYFLWHGEHGDFGIYNLQKIIDENGLEKAGSLSSGLYGPVYTWHYFAEPLYGYYFASDEWVLRKHAELLTNANIDFLYFDVTNASPYISNALKLMKCLHELNEQGYDAPQVVFYTNTNAVQTVRTIYDEIYAKNLYPDTWYCVEGKPVIVAPKEANIDKYFTIKLAQWPNESTRKTNAWPWMDFNWPARVFVGTSSTGKKDYSDAISVSVAQHAGNTIFSSSALYDTHYNNRGRSFCTPISVLKDSAEYKKALRDAFEGARNDPTLSYKGLNFQSQWDYALKSSAKYYLVTGWNEWIAQRQPSNSICDVVFVDTASVEYSRDCEMMRGGYFDNYYMQLAFNVQRAKGTAPLLVQDARNPINVTGNFDQWDKVIVTYTDYKGDTADRNGSGFGQTKYTNTSGRNDIVASKVTSDTKNLYFYVQTADNITKYDNSTSWMQLYLDIDSSASTGWYGYDFLINRSVKDDFTSTICKYENGEWKEAGEIRYRVKGNEMMLEVPMSTLGVSNYAEINLQFKWADSIVPYESMENFYENGDVAPLGRLNYVYQNYIPGLTIDLGNESDTNTESDETTSIPSATETGVENDKGCFSAISTTAGILITATTALAGLSLRRRRRRQ